MCAQAVIGTTGGTIHIFGAPAVESTLSLPEPVAVKFLQFSLSNYRLVCVGANYSCRIQSGYSAQSSARRKQPVACVGSVVVREAKIVDFG